jgi:hypothetical protein
MAARATNPEPKTPKLPAAFGSLVINDQERTPLVVQLLEIIAYQNEEVQCLKDELARLKGEKGRPDIKPSSLEHDRPEESEQSESKRTAKNRKKRKKKKRKKAKKTSEFTIHGEQKIPAVDVPEEAEFKGYKDWVVQGIRFELFNVKYRREWWRTPEGKDIIAELPEEIRASHYSPELRRFILYQYHELHVTHPLILKQLRELEIEISSATISDILNKGKDTFHQEKAEILRVGLEVSKYVNTDDTGARHKGQNGYTTHIGNELFAWFETTSSKSRINFLELLRQGQTDYLLDEYAWSSMEHYKLPKKQLALLQGSEKIFPNKEDWNAYLYEVGISNERQLRIVTEATLLSSLLSHGLSPELVIVSDDAGQFNVLGFLHALCWVHAERTINKITPYSDDHRKALDDIRGRIWDLYKELKADKLSPNEKNKKKLAAEFDSIFTTKTSFQFLNLALQRLYKNKEELLLVLKRPEIPLHNNLSENDIRDFVKKRKISASTRSELGRECRDTFLSLKKTCAKLGVSFWDYLLDRLSGRNQIPPLPILIQQAALGP